MALTGVRVALAEGRQLEELAAMLAKEGAQPVRCPMLSIIDPPDTAPVHAWLQQLYADRFAWVIFLTGEGVRRLYRFAESQGHTELFVAALRRTKILIRGPKPLQALRPLGVTPTRVAESPITDGVIASLRDLDLTGLCVGVQLYAPDNPPLLNYLKAAAAEPHTVLPYLYAPAADSERVVRLIHQLADGSIQVLVLTSSPQLDRLLEVAKAHHLEAELRSGLARTCIASVGPVMTQKLRELGFSPTIQPEQGFVMKNLVQHIKRHFS